MKNLEPMDAFFAARVNGYDEHMLNEVGGCKQGYIKTAQAVPRNTKTLLDLGCGTGLELDEIFRHFPALCVTGIDLTQAMLDKLKEKHPDKSMHLLCADYFTAELGESSFDCAVSFQTMHHFTHEKKTELYKRIHHALTADGVYIECDYMVDTQAEEDLYFAENRRLRQQQNIPEDAFFHYDTPCTVENQIQMLKSAGFSFVKQVFREENTTLLVARKSQTGIAPTFEEVFQYGPDATVPPVRVRVSARALITDGDKILYSHEGKNDVYMSPGGGVEDGETYAECCAREVLEETGYIVKPTVHFCTVNEYCPEALYISPYFLCEIVGQGEKHLTEIEIDHKLAPKWLTFDEALAVFGTYQSKRPDHASLYLREFTVLNKYLKEKNKKRETEVPRCTYCNIHE